MEEAQFLTTVHEHQGIIYKVCRLYRESREDREDLFQEIIFQLWRSLPGFKGEAKISTWIYRIALSTAMAVYRKKSPVIEYAPVLPDLPEEEQNEETALRQERLFRAMQQLDDSEKAIIILYLEGLSYREIAQLTGIQENYVGVRLNRIRNKVKKLLIKKL